MPAKKKSANYNIISDDTPDESLAAAAQASAEKTAPVTAAKSFKLKARLELINKSSETAPANTFTPPCVEYAGRFDVGRTVQYFMSLGSEDTEKCSFRGKEAGNLLTVLEGLSVRKTMN